MLLQLIISSSMLRKIKIVAIEFEKDMNRERARDGESKKGGVVWW